MPSGGQVQCTHLRGDEERWARKEACGAGRLPLGLRGTGIDSTLAGLLACRALQSAKAICVLKWHSQIRDRLTAWIRKSSFGP